MVTVIATKQELTAPNKNGLTGADSNDNERPYSFIRDYQEVNFHRLVSCKPLPDDLFGIDGQITKTSIKGIFFLQIDELEPYIQINTNQNEQTNNTDRIVLTLTDGIRSIKAMINDPIPSLNFKTKIGSKLLLTDTIPIKDGMLQLTSDNAQYQNGSNTYSRARPSRRTRGSGSYRSSYEGRRSNRYDNDDGETNFMKRPPPKTTLMDFMTSLNLNNDNESEKPKERHDTNRRRSNQSEQYNGTNKSNPQVNMSMNYNQNGIAQQVDIDEQLDSEDDPSYANHRERRNPLPPRLQRVQEERSRRNPSRYYEESMSGNDFNSIYPNDTLSNAPLSSMPSAYILHGDQTSYLSTNPSTGQPHVAAQNLYTSPTNLMAGVHSSTPTHLAYFQTNPSPLGYNIAGLQSPPYPSFQTMLGPSYPNDHLAFCYGAPYAAPNYLPPTVANNSNGDTKTNGSTYSDNETVTNSGSQNDENNDSGIKSETSSTEQKQTSLSCNDNNTNVQEEKRRDLNSNPKPRWKIGDVCLARWSDDGEFYYATVMDIHPPYCTVFYNEYNSYDQVRFNDMKVIPRDQQYYPVIHPTADLNLLSGTYFAPRANYYPSTMDGCILMPEPPPFPFNSSGTLCMYPMAVSRSSNRYNGNGFQQPVQQNETINSSSSSSKNSNDTSGVDTSTTLSNDDNQHPGMSLPQQSSITDAPLVLVTSDELCEHNKSTESLTSSKYDEEQSMKET